MTKKADPKSKTKELHVDPCDMVCEIRDELIAFKKELRANFWKKVGVAISVLTLAMTTSIGGCAYIVDRTTAKFDEATKKDEAITERIHAQERKTDKTEMILETLVTMQQEGRDDIRSIKEAQHRIELSIAQKKDE